jgi:hypothetical protein
MTFDAGTTIVLALALLFAGFIVWAELHSRRNRRSERASNAEASHPATPDEDPTEPSPRKVRTHE